MPVMPPILQESHDGKCACNSWGHSSVGPQSATAGQTPPSARGYGLPASFLKDRALRSLGEENTDDIIDYLKIDLDLSRLDKIHNCLWLAGRPHTARPLHRQLMMAREVIITEQFGLHLVWRGYRMFLKPLPAYLLDYDFWKAYLVRQETDIERKKQAAILHSSACGLIMSYIWLIRHRSDMKIAQDKSLVPNMKWEQWRKFTKTFLARIGPTTLERVNRRFHHGELRAGRLNLIYRFYTPIFSLRNCLRGYTVGYDRHGLFFQENFGWLIMVFAVLPVLLSAMQTGLTTNRLKNDIRFQRASFGFVCPSIILPVAIIGLALILLLILIVDNFLVTRKIQKRLWKQRYNVVPKKPSIWRRISRDMHASNAALS